MILLTISLVIVTEKLLNVSAIILGVNKFLLFMLFMFRDFICLWEFALRLIIDLVPSQVLFLLQNSVCINVTY